MTSRIESDRCVAVKRVFNCLHKQTHNCSIFSAANSSDDDDDYDNHDTCARRSVTAAKKMDVTRTATKVKCFSLRIISIRS